MENYAGEDAPGLLFYRPQRRAELYPGSKALRRSATFATRGIKTLEKEFGARLFERSKSNVRLTQLGLLVRPDFERVSQATTFLAQRITELKAASPSKPSATAMEAPMRATVLAVTTIALILLG
ncbi:MAG: LysR family transcriptional regulator, partial [Pseudolabrys sp.]